MNDNSTCIRLHHQKNRYFFYSYSPIPNFFPFFLPFAICSFQKGFKGFIFFIFLRLSSWLYIQYLRMPIDSTELHQKFLGSSSRNWYIRFPCMSQTEQGILSSTQSFVWHIGPKFVANEKNSINPKLSTCILALSRLICACQHEKRPEIRV